MEKRGYLGIDESNHGRVPEVFVAVFSVIPEDILPVYSDGGDGNPKPGLSKKRKREQIPAILGRRSYKHAVLLGWGADYMGYRSKRVDILSKLITSFGGLEKVIIDGELLKHDLGVLRRNVGDLCTNIVVIPEADTTYPIVNAADQIAIMLSRYYSALRNVDLTKEDYTYSLVA